MEFHSIPLRDRTTASRKARSMNEIQRKSVPVLCQLERGLATTFWHVSAPTRIGRPGATDRGCLTDKTIIFTLGLARSLYSQERRSELTHWTTLREQRAKSRRIVVVVFAGKKKKTSRGILCVPPASQTALLCLFLVS